jgi:hypothetical protein
LGDILHLPLTTLGKATASNIIYSPSFPQVSTSSLNLLPELQGTYTIGWISPGSLSGNLKSALQHHTHYSLLPINYQYWWIISPPPCCSENLSIGSSSLYNCSF